MSDTDYGVNADDPESIIACILDDAERAKYIISELDSLGFVVAPKEPNIRMMQAGVIAWRQKHDSQVYAEPLAEACYKAMLDRRFDR